MQFTTVISLLVAAVAVSAAPGTSVNARQEFVGTAYARLFPNGGCEADTPWVDDYVFVQRTGPQSCQNVAITAPHGSARISDNNTKCVLRVFPYPNCSENPQNVNYRDFKAGENDCNFGRLASGIFIC